MAYAKVQDNSLLSLYQRLDCKLIYVWRTYNQRNGLKKELDGELNHRPARNNSNYLLISNCPSEDNKNTLASRTLQPGLIDKLLIWFFGVTTIS